MTSLVALPVSCDDSHNMYSGQVSHTLPNSIVSRHGLLTPLPWVETTCIISSRDRPENRNRGLVRQARTLTS